MFGFLRNTRQQNFDFHLERTWKLLIVAKDRFSRADNYTLGAGFGNEATRHNAAIGAVAKAGNAMSEALFNAQKALNYYNNQQSAYNTTSLQKIAINIRQISGHEFLTHPELIANWDNTNRSWVNEYNELLNKHGLLASA